MRRTQRIPVVVFFLRSWECLGELAGFFESCVVEGDDSGCEEDCGVDHEVGCESV